MASLQDLYTVARKLTMEMRGGLVRDNRESRVRL